MNKKIVVIETLTTGTGFNLFYQNREDNFYLLTNDPQKYREIRRAKIPGNLAVIPVDTTNESSLVEVIKQRITKPDAVLSLSDSTVEIAAKVASHFGCCQNKSKTLKLCRDKFALRNYLSNCGIQTIEHALLSGELLDDHRDYPYILKPNSGTGSKGVLLANNFTELKRNYALLKSRYSEILLERFVRGPLISNEVFVSNGEVKSLGISSRILGNFPYFVEEGVAFPMNIGSLEKDVICLSKQILQALDYRHGPVHIEYILSTTGPVLVEVNPRLGGGPIGNMLLHCLSGNIYQAICREFLGEPGDIQKIKVIKDKGMAVLLVGASKAGIVNELDISEMLDYPGISKVEKLVHVGTKVRLAKDYTDELVRIYAVGKSSEEAFYRALAAKNALNLTIV